MNKVLLFAAFFSLGLLNAQSNLPEGWDNVIMDGKEAYININTGEIVNYRPKGKARATSYTKNLNSSNSYSSSSSSHTVKNGETLSIIARKYNVKLGTLYSANPSIDFNKLAVGQEINIGNNSSGSGNYHVVQTGETLFSIAQTNGLSVSKLKSLNNLSSNSIRVGQKLRIHN